MEEDSERPGSLVDASKDTVEESVSKPDRVVNTATDGEDDEAVPVVSAPQTTNLESQSVRMR